jgi:hypothetical protein
VAAGGSGSYSSAVRAPTLRSFVPSCCFLAEVVGALRRDRLCGIVGQCLKEDC